MSRKNRLNRERKTVSKMIALFCRAHHNPPTGELCSACQSLADYAHQRIDRCPFGWHKTTCAKCSVHCYKPDRREDIRQIMRYAGPHMMLQHPLLAVLHLMDGLRKPPAR